MTLNRLAAKAVALNARTPAEARMFLQMLGIVDGDRILPDDTRTYASRDDAQTPGVPMGKHRPRGLAS